MERDEFEIEARRMRPHLYHQALRYIGNTDEAEDVTQDVLLKLWSMRTQLDEYHSVEALAIVMTKRICINHLRSGCDMQCSLDGVDVADEDSTDAALMSQDELRRIDQVMKMLPDVQQATLRMKHIDGLEVDEIARMMGCEVVTVRTNLSRARKKMMDYFFNNKR